MTADVAEQRDRDRVEAADRVGIGVDLDDRLVRRDAGVVRERRAEHDQQVGLVHVPRRDRRAAAAEHAARERMVVGDDALGFERGEDRRVQPFGEADDVVDAARALRDPTTITGRFAPGDQRAGLFDRVRRRGAIARSATRPLGPPGASVGRGGQCLHLVGQHEVRHAALHERVLAREVHQLDVVGVALDRLGRHRDVGERGREVEILERAATAHLRRHLARDREHRRRGRPWRRTGR